MWDSRFSSPLPLVLEEPVPLPVRATDLQTGQASDPQAVPVRALVPGTVPPTGRGWLRGSVPRRRGQTLPLPAPNKICTECPKIYRKSVLHLLQYRCAVYLCMYSSEIYLLNWTAKLKYVLSLLPSLPGKYIIQYYGGGWVEWPLGKKMENEDL